MTGHAGHMAGNAVAANFIWTLHVVLVLFVALTPFLASSTSDLLVLHAIVCPFLILHWLTSTDGCVLTLLETRLRGLETVSESFMHRLVAPVYVIDDAALRYLVSGTTMGLWILTLRRLCVK